MHYGAKDFAIDTAINTIDVLQAGAVIGQRSGLSTEDIRQLNLFYGCEGIH